MVFAEVHVDQKFHSHIIGKKGANGVLPSCNHVSFTCTCSLVACVIFFGVGELPILPVSFQHMGLPKCDRVDVVMKLVYM